MNNTVLLLIAFGLVALSSVFRLILFFTAPKDTEKEKARQQVGDAQ